MKMNKADMAKMDMENETSEGDVGKATPAHESAETGTKEHQEDMAQDSSEGEDMNEEDMGMEDDYKAQCDANDLLRAAEIKSDPMRMKAALDILGQKKKAIDSMEELMAVRKDKMMKKES